MPKQSGLRLRISGLFRGLADRIDPPLRLRPQEKLQLQDLLSLPGGERLDWRSLDQGEVRVRYRATDAVWGDVEGNGNLIDLREHVRRMCVAAREIGQFAQGDGWGDVAHNLRLAYALTDLFADTDVDGLSMWCNPVADYESADSELAAKHLAATIVFTFVWTAWESLIDVMGAGVVGKGAKGRDIVVRLASGEMPHFRAVLFNAFALDYGQVDFAHRDMRRLLDMGSLPGIAAEYLRQFRNRVIHGDVQKPEPGDWGDSSKYRADEDPHLRRFHTNIRLLLLLLQIIARSLVDRGTHLESWLEYPRDGKSALEQLHCAERWYDGEPEMDLNSWP